MIGTCHLLDAPGGGIFYGPQSSRHHSVRDRSFQRRKVPTVVGTCHLLDAPGRGIFYGPQVLRRHSIRDRSFQRRKVAMIMATCHLFDAPGRRTFVAAEEEGGHHDDRFEADYAGGCR